MPFHRMFAVNTSMANGEKDWGIAMEKNKSDDLMTIPGVGITCVADLKGKDPEELYTLDCLNKGFQEERCQLYVFRCAVYYAEHEQHESEKLKWWYWKEKKYSENG